MKKLRIISKSVGDKYIINVFR